MLRQPISSEDYRCDTDENRQVLLKSVEWSKQLSRDADGVMPSYMEKTVTSRMAVSLANYKTLQMNCTDLK